MNTIRVRQLEIGAGIPKICASIIGQTKEEIFTEAKCFLSLPIDIAEWRIDFFEDVFNAENVHSILIELRRILGDRPLLLTFRCANEGGMRDISLEAYKKLNLLAIRSGLVDLIDIELSSDETLVKELINIAHSSQVKVIVSSHDFEKTPSKEVLLSRFRKMQELDADLPKIAVMPQNKKDLLTLLAAAEEMSSCYADRPLIAISMSKEGMISRLCGEFFGSAITFASAKNISAPGQIHAAELKKGLDFLHQLSV